MKPKKSSSPLPAGRVKIGRRGRKVGDGILKEISPQMNALERARAFAYGRSANEQPANLIRRTLTLLRLGQHLRAQEQKLGINRIEARGHDGCEDTDVNQFLKDKRWLDSRMAENRERLVEKFLGSIWNGNSNWFRKVAAALDAEKGSDAYPLHASIVELFQPGWHRDEIIWPPDPAYGGVPFVPLDTQNRFTIEDVREKLKANGVKQPQTQTDENWSSTIRRACKEVGLTLAPMKPGPKTKKT